jgi:Ca2+/Na+ antiporter
VGIRTKLLLTLDSGVGFACEHARVRSDHVSDGSGRVRIPNDGASAGVFPLYHNDPALRRNVWIMAGTLFGFALLCATGDIGRVAGILLLIAFALIMLATAGSTIWAKQDADTSTPLDWVLGLPSRPSMIDVFIIGGVVVLPLGAQRRLR